MKRILLIIICLALFCPAMVLADVIYVSGDVSGIWSADTVFVTGEIIVPVGDTLIIEPGVEVLFQVNCEFTVDSAACLFAVGTETDSIRFDACIPGFNWHGIRFSYASDSSRLEYCWITDSDDSGVNCNYSNPKVMHCRIENCSADGGGGIKCVRSSPIIMGNVIAGNIATMGAGIHCHYQSSPVISGNVISGNIAYWSYGGGIYCYNESNPVISDNVISGNMVFNGSGGGISCEGSSPTISGNSFVGNHADSFYGGAIFCDFSSPEIHNNTFYANSAHGGGGIHCYVSSDPIISRNLLVGNYTSDRDGGAICCNNSNPAIINNTIVGNSTGGEGGGIYCGSASDITIVNTILWNNTPEQICVFTGVEPSVTYCDVQGGWGGLGNINEDPSFINAVLGDFHLQWGSPCIDAGDPNSPLDPDGTVADIGAFYYNQLGVGGGTELAQPLIYRLFPNYPNPFNPTTTLTFVMPFRSHVSLAVYDLLGRQVAIIIDDICDAGNYEVVFDGSGLASGVYFCRLHASGNTLTQKMVLVK